MKIDPDSVKIEQAQRISSVGCIGVVIVLIILVLIGAVIIRADLSGKRGAALTARSRMLEQVNKAPGVLDRMMAYECAGNAQGYSEAEAKIDLLDVNSPLSEIEESWDLIEDAWSAISGHCLEESNQSAFQDLTTEMEGLRNRISVENGNYHNASNIYNSALESMPANIAAYGFEKLE